MAIPSPEARPSFSVLLARACPGLQQSHGYPIDVLRAGRFVKRIRVILSPFDVGIYPLSGHFTFDTYLDGSNVMRCRLTNRLSHREECKSQHRYCARVTSASAARRLSAATDHPQKRTQSSTPLVLLVSMVASGAAGWALPVRGRHLDECPGRAFFTGYGVPTAGAVTACHGTVGTRSLPGGAMSNIGRELPPIEVIPDVEPEPIQEPVPEPQSDPVST